MEEKNKLSSLSIFFPAFNEEKNIPIVVEQALDLAPKISQKFEILIVDDGSSDRTAEVAEEIAGVHPEVKLLRHEKNLGYGSALKSGFYNCRYDYITYMDSDGQFNFSEIEKLLAKINEADIVAGYRIKRADNKLRILNGYLWNILVDALLGLHVKDIDCGFKLMKKKVLDTIPRLESTGATISAELIVKAGKKGFRIVQVGLDHKPRKYGKATGGNPLHIFRAFADLITIIPKIR